MRHLTSISRFLAIIAVFVFFSTPLLSQQKIQIKNGSTPVGHFFAEILHNLPGAPMKSFLGTGQDIGVDQPNNKFILRMQNFVWYDPDHQVELAFDTKTINVQSETVISFDQLGEVVTLKPVRSYIRDIYIQSSGLGKVKLLIPFTYDGGEGRFMQEFNITDGIVTEKPVEKKNLSSRDIRNIWSEVDENNLEEVNKFIVNYQDESSAKRYLKKAERISKDLLLARAEEALAKKEKQIERENSESKAKKDDKEGGDRDVKELTVKTVTDDIQAVIDTLMVDEIVEEVAVDKALYLTIGDETPEKISLLASQLPLQIQFHEIGQEPSLINRIPIMSFRLDTMVTVNKELLKEHNLKGDFTSLNVFDAFGKDVFRSDINLVTRKGSKNSSLFYILGISGLLLGFGVWVFFNSSKKEKKRQATKKDFAEKLKKNQAKVPQKEIVKGSQSIHTEVSTSAVKPAANSKIRIGAKPKESKTVKAVAPSNSIARTSGSSRFKITKRKTNGIPIAFSDFVDIANKYETVNVDLTKIWHDTTIHNVYLAPEFIKSLDNFLAESSNDGIQNELQGAIPEVGGFMMGRFAEKDNSLEVLVERFVPFVPEYNDVFKIEIGTKTLVDELGDAQDKNPELEVIGWFHTHPGHGLFLSTSDLSVQRHFPNNYQVAMEIDSLTSGLDMSIFTRKSDGRMNNSTDRKDNVGWFQWVEIDNNNVDK